MATKTNKNSKKTVAVIAKLNDAKVLAIKKLLADGHSQAEIVAKTGLKRSTVWNIAAGTTWKHIKVGGKKSSKKSSK